MGLYYKYAILKDKGEKPTQVNVTYFGSTAVDTRSEDNFVKNSDRLSFFNQLMVSKNLLELFQHKYLLTIAI